jgi:hypothetical protein
LKLLTMASHLNPSNRKSHVCNLSQLICDISAGLTQLLGVKVEIYQLSTLPTSSLETSSPTSGGPLAPSGSFLLHCNDNRSRTWALISKPVFQCSQIMKCNYEAKALLVRHSPNRYKPTTDI